MVVLAFAVERRTFLPLFLGEKPSFLFLPTLSYSRGFSRGFGSSDNGANDVIISDFA